MEQRQKRVDTQQLLEAYLELLPQVESLPLGITGSSMTPFLVPDRDSVWLCAIDRPLRKGDVVLYRRSNGAYILHRICKYHRGTFSMVGDAHCVVESGIQREQIFARVCQVERKGIILTPGCFWWEFFEKVWVRVIPLRPMLLRMGTTTGKLFRR